MAKKSKNTEEKIQVVEEALSKTEVFIEKNQKVIVIVVVAIALIVLGYFAFQKFYVAPKEKEALSQMFMAEKYFEIDSLNLALNGDGQYPGFLQIIDDYGITKSGKVAHYYAGIVYLKLGKFDEALNHLKKFKTKDAIVYAMALNAIGDCYMEKNDAKTAAEKYLEAADYNKNDITSPTFIQKAATAYQIAGKKDEALKIFERLKFDYPNSTEGREADKYIMYLQGASN